MTELRGEVLHIVFASDDGQYVVMRMLDTERNREVTLVGPLGGVLEGQEIEAAGRWENHKQHGRQFRVERFRAILPTSEHGIRRYLASGVIPGIGPVLADRIVKRFGERTLDILDRYSARLREVPGLGRKRLDQIRDAWRRHAQERDVLIFLQGLGLGPAACARILKRYGMGAAEVVRRNPYLLAREVHGIGFSTADRIAAGLGVEPTSLIRLSAGVVFALEQMADNGHTCYPRERLIEVTAELLDVAPELARAGIDRAVLDGAVIEETKLTPGDTTYLYLRRLYTAETELAECLRNLLAVPPPRVPPAARPKGEQWQRLDETQRGAVRTAFTSGISIITGGPGVGKTTVVGQIVAIARRGGLRVLLAAPTGRAAKRLGESCRVEAKTIHRLLKWDPAAGTFVHGPDSPLKCDLLILDEVSMLDVQLARQVFGAVAPGARVVLVGDKDQLPSVGPGDVLHDILRSERVPATHLAKIYRQQENSRIVWNAHRVNHGEMPDLRKAPGDRLEDFYWIDQDDPERAVRTIVRMVAVNIPRRFGVDPVNDIQVLTPMHRGSCGAAMLNERLQNVLTRSDAPGIRLGERVLRVGDRVMQVANNYDKGVFNGELGRVVQVDPAAKILKARFDAGVIEYEVSELHQLQLAYAVTVHKSQGSEFPVVVMPVLTQHFIMLQRNLVYTAMTRAKRLLVMVGTRKALAIAVRNARPSDRCSLLRYRLAAP